MGETARACYFKAYDFKFLVGKKAKRNISIDQFIKKGDV